MVNKKSGFLDRAAKGVDLMRIAQASIGPNGKPDIWKAQRMAKLKGFTSREDHIQLVAIIQSMGGFDQKPSSTINYNMHETRDSYDWREHCEDGSEWGIDPEDFATEEDYEEALCEAKYEWREFAEDGEEWGLDPEDFETEEDYEEALEEAKAEWEDSEEEDDSSIDLAWRNYCEDGSDWGIDPEEFEDELDYKVELNFARGLSRITWGELTEEEFQKAERDEDGDIVYALYGVEFPDQVEWEFYLGDPWEYDGNNRVIVPTDDNIGEREGIVRCGRYFYETTNKYPIAKKIIRFEK